jgi:hypothetical protein
VASRTALALLESLQQNAYSQRGIDPKRRYSDPEAMKLCFENAEKLAAAWAEGQDGQAELRRVTKEHLRDVIENATSKYDNPFLMQSTGTLAGQIEESAAKLDLHLPSRPLLGTMPLGDINAFTVVVPSTDEYLVIFENEMFHFAHLAAKAIAELVPMKRKEDSMLFSLNASDVERELEARPEAIDRFAQLVVAYLATGLPGAAPPWLQSTSRSALSTLLRRSIGLFVVGHEYGHIIANHLGNRSRVSSVAGAEPGMSPDVKIADHVVYSWKQEIEADILGLELMLDAMASTKVSLSLRYFGADFYFSLMALLRRGRNMLARGDEDDEEPTLFSSSHPPAELRREAIRNVIKDSFPAEVSEMPLAIGNHLAVLLELLWSQIRPQIIAAYRAGYRPQLTTLTPDT